MYLVDMLLVEDNPDHAILTKKVLEENCVANRIYLVGDGEEARFVFNNLAPQGGGGCGTCGSQGGCS